MAALLDIVKKGVTDRSVTLRIIDSTDGTPETGVVWDTAGIDLWYRREGAAKTSITEATLASLTTAHADGGFLHVGDGEYRLDLPDAAFATGANHVDIGGTVTGMIVLGGRVRLVDVDLEDTVRAGLTALPNAAAAAVGGLPTVDSSNSVKSQTGLKRNVAIADWPFFMTDSAAHNPATGLSPLPVVYYSHNGGTSWTSLGSSVEGADGFYKITLTAAAMNNPTVAIKATATGADMLPVTLHTDP